MSERSLLPLSALGPMLRPLPCEGKNFAPLKINLDRRYCAY